MGTGKQFWINVLLTILGYIPSNAAARAMQHSSTADDMLYNAYTDANDAADLANIKMPGWTDAEAVNF
jgi:hypothetical protein